MYRSQSFGVALLASSTLLLESTLLRILAVAQYYHFAFLVISLALLGFGASGSFLSLASKVQSKTKGWKLLKNGPNLIIISGIFYSTSIAIAYIIVNFLPFDSYSIAWERKQILLFLIYYLVLSLPFFFSGLCIGGSLAIYKGESHKIYAANLIGSAVGVLIAPGTIWLAGILGALIICIFIGLIAVFVGRSVYKTSEENGVNQNAPKNNRWIVILGSIIIILISAEVILSVINLDNRSPIGLIISPYKGLSHAKRYPGSEVILGRWNAISRIDILKGAGTRQLPGLSYEYSQPPPIQHGISIDAEALQPISLVKPDDFDAARFMPEYLVFLLRPKARVLILEPAGGLGVLQAMAGSANQITAVIDNPMLVDSVIESAPGFEVFHHPDVDTVIKSPRVFVRNATTKFDIVFIPLTDSYRPITSGAYSLSETYNLTVEAFNAYLDNLNPGGIFVITRWLQTPPSESLKLINTINRALQLDGSKNPDEAVIAYRGIQTITVLVNPEGWENYELNRLREFLDARKFDLVWAPGMDPEEANRYNKLPEPVYYNYFSILMKPNRSDEFSSTYPYAIDPPIDDRPFFYHFFTWKQTPEVIANIGRTWQPFGGSGYFVLLALLLLVIIFSIVLILIPMLINIRISMFRETFWRTLLYFSALGCAFLFIEIPLIQQSILILGNPTYAFTVVVFALLSFSGIGSYFARSRWLPKRLSMGFLIILALISPWLIARFAHLILGWTFVLRAVAVVIYIAPLAILMGIPFPSGLAWLEQEHGDLVPWAWAINGCASVIAAVLAAILTLGYGYRLVLLIGAVAYLVAFLVLPSKWYKPDWT